MWQHGASDATRLAALVEPGSTDNEGDRMAMTEYFDFEVRLQEIEPAIWRRFLLRRTLSFQALHEAIQAASGSWRDYHLYCFYSTHGKPEPIAETPHDEERMAPPAGQVRLSRYFTGYPPQACLYLYDYGDSWHHDVVLRSVVRSSERFERHLLGGERAFPPEDCGSIPGYERMVEFRRTGVDTVEDDPRGLASWLGDWQPEAFDVDAARSQFDR